jgi:REP element-mobilizing transposase RayT
MAYDPSIHHRRSIRLNGFDYTQPGAYFITIVAHRRLPIFGEITGGIVYLNAFGEIVHKEWMKTIDIRREIALDEFVVMPNHFHAIVTIVECGNGLVGATGRSPLRPDMPRGPANKSLASLIAGFKSAVTTRINQLHGTPGAPVWQRNYWEHVIRNDGELSRIREYIRNNPITLETDDENSVRRDL